LAAAIGQIVARDAAFSVFCNCFIFSIFSALGREKPQNLPFVISKFPALANSRQTDNWQHGIAGCQGFGRRGHSIILKSILAYNDSDVKGKDAQLPRTSA
jgi:hypothetical protein